MMNFIATIVGGLLLMLVMTSFITAAAFSPDVLMLLCIMVVVFAFNGEVALTLVAGVSAWFLLGML